MSKSFASQKKSRLVSLGILLFIILIIPLTVIIAQQVQDIRQRATDSQTPPPLPPGGAVSLTMTPNIFNLTIGAATATSAQIAINAGSNNITGVDFTLSYNPAMIKVVGFTPTTGFDQELYKIIDNTTGKLRFAAVDTTTTTANTGSVPVGTIQFSGSTVGTSTGTFQSVQITALGYTGALPNTTNDTATFTVVPLATATSVPTNTPVPPTATTTPLPPTATATVPPATNTPTQAPLPGNFNGDTTVDILDFNRWRNEFTKVATTLTADANNDGKVDLIDFSFWRNAFGTTSPTSTTAPNPTATTAPSPTPTRTPTPSPTIFITPTPIPTFSLTGQGAFNLSIAGYSLPLNGTLTFDQTNRKMILTCKVSAANCGFTAGLGNTNRTGQTLYNPVISVSNLNLGNGQTTSVLQYVNFNGQLTSTGSTTTKTIEPNGSAIGTYIKITSPQVIGNYSSSISIDARTCNNQVSPPDCYAYGGSALRVEVNVTQ